MQLRIDAKSGVPIYVQLKNQIKYQIATGRLARGAQLPTVRQLAVDLTINPNTVARVYLELEREGLLVTQQGRGTFVAEREQAVPAEDERRKTLQAMIRAVLTEGLHLGFSPQEIREELQAALSYWEEMEHA